ncbi:MAG: hypothetical protein AAF716_02420 [Cyanobacteria bacterium P01_D01_bin.1]
MKLKISLIGLSSAAFLIAATPTAAIAGPFGNILNSVDEVNSTVNEVNETVDTIEQAVHTFNSLSSMLGLDAGISSSISDSDPTGQIMELYGIWFANQQSLDRENIAWLVTEYAANRETSLEAVAASSWFLQKPTAEQTRISDAFTKVQSLLEASSQDGDRFLGYAACINAGSSDCAI